MLTNCERTDIYLFPEIVKDKEGSVPVGDSSGETIDRLVNKISEECVEFIDEYCVNGASVAAMVELLDLYHACESLFRHVLTDEEFVGLALYVFGKNNKRGYYDVVEVDPTTPITQVESRVESRLDNLEELVKLARVAGVSREDD